jgi:hypothetical protein
MRAEATAVGRRGRKGKRRGRRRRRLSWGRPSVPRPRRVRLQRGRGQDRTVTLQGAATAPHSATSQVATRRAGRARFRTRMPRTTARRATPLRRARPRRTAPGGRRRRAGARTSGRPASGLTAGPPAADEPASGAAPPAARATTCSTIASRLLPPPYCCPYPCPYCTLTPPSLLLPLPVSLLYTPSVDNRAPFFPPPCRRAAAPARRAPPPCETAERCACIRSPTGGASARGGR